LVSKLVQSTTVLWLTGLSGSGKTTIAQALEQRLCSNLGFLVCILDGDKLRQGLNSDLSLSEKDRKENIRRTAHVAKLFSETGIVVICSLISPYIKARELARSIIGAEFKEIYIKCPIEECKKRDPKGLYAKHDRGEIKGLTGIDAPYEEPLSPDLVIETDKKDIKECVNLIVRLLET